MPVILKMRNVIFGQKAHTQIVKICVLMKDMNHERKLLKKS